MEALREGGGRIAMTNRTLALCIGVALAMWIVAEALNRWAG